MRPNARDELPGGGSPPGPGEATPTTPLLTPRPSLASLPRELSVTFGGVPGGGGGAPGAQPTPPPSAPPPSTAELEALYVRRRMRENPMWSLDRGSGRNDADRVAFRKASLLSTGM
jgi:hypothetical protein